MVIIIVGRIVLPALLRLLPIALPTLLLLLPIALLVFAVGRLGGLATGLRFLGRSLAAGLLAPSCRLHVLRGGLAAGLLAGTLGLPIAATGGPRSEKNWPRENRPYHSEKSLHRPQNRPHRRSSHYWHHCSGKSRRRHRHSNHPPAATSPTTPLGFSLHRHTHAHQEQATSRCPLDPLLRAHRCCPPVVAAPGSCCRGENAICAAPTGGVKANRASGTSDARFQSLNCAQNCGRTSACR